VLDTPPGAAIAAVCAQITEHLTGKPPGHIVQEASIITHPIICLRTRLQGMCRHVD